MQHRILCLVVLAVALLFCPYNSYNVWAEEWHVSPNPADVNRDGVVDIADAAYVLQVVNGRDVGKDFFLVGLPSHDEEMEVRPGEKDVLLHKFFLSDSFKDCVFCGWLYGFGHINVRLAFYNIRMISPSGKEYSGFEHVFAYENAINFSWVSLEPGEWKILVDVNSDYLKGESPGDFYVKANFPRREDFTIRDKQGQFINVDAYFPLYGPNLYIIP